jgi:hypothetical protein
VALFDPQDPFNFGASWGSVGTSGASSSGDGFISGGTNVAASGSGVFAAGSSTIMCVGAALNPAVFVLNATERQPLLPLQFLGAPISFPTGFPAQALETSGVGNIGVFGQATPNSMFPSEKISFPTVIPTRNIGVAGLSDVGGAGVYGVTGSVDIEGTGVSPPVPGKLGIGVVGRAMDGVAVEDTATETLPVFLADGSMGVLGTSMTGVGVRGHSGPLVAGGGELSGGPPGPGGVFSAGLLAPTGDGGNVNELVSLNPLPQLRLIPGPGTPPGVPPGPGSLPAVGHLGDLYAMATVEPVNLTNLAQSCRLFLCVLAGNGSPGNPTAWAEILQDTPTVIG